MQAGLEKQWDEHEKIEWYLAQIAVTIERLFMEHPDKLQVADRLLNFGSGQAPPKVEEEEEAIVPAMDPSKAYWLGWLGVKVEE